MKQIDALFDRMDSWRHLPNYQLERRADLFFALYLSKALEAKLGFPIRPELVPEFRADWDDLPAHSYRQILQDRLCCPGC